MSLKVNNFNTGDGYIKAVASGKRRSKEVYANYAATGAIAPGSQFAANESVVVNGVRFTAVASGASGNQFVIGADLGESIDNLVTVLNASTDGNVSVATYANDSDTSLTVTFDSDHENGNKFKLSTNKSGATVTDMTGGASGVLEDAYHFNLVTQDSADGDFTLADGEDGDEVSIYFKTKGTSTDATINGNFEGGGTTLTLDAAGEYVKLVFFNSDWNLLVDPDTATIA